MKGLIVVIVALLLLPGSVVMLLSANFGALKGYLIGATCFFGFLTMLTVIWTFGLPGTPPLTGPVGPTPTFKQFTSQSPKAQEFNKVQDFRGGEGNGWQAEPQEAGTLKEDLDAARQALVAAFMKEHNQGVKESAKEVDVINLDAKTFYTIQNGTEVAAVVISPKDPPQGSGLERPTFQPVTEFAYRDPGFPNLYNYIILAGAVLLTALHILLLARAERRQPLGAARAPAAEPRETAGTGARG
jgi:hypothetical protein